jgi:hypothetical protein
MPNTNPTALYGEVIEVVNHALVEVLGQTSSQSAIDDLQKAFESSTVLLEKFRDKTLNDVDELRELSEWETFTIAFYGETNAGKSTLIESLRILLCDAEKLAVQQQFEALAKELRVDAQSLADLEKSIRSLELQLTECHGRAETLKVTLPRDEQLQCARLEALKVSIEHKRRNLSFWQRLVFMFRKMDEEKGLREEELKLAQLKAAAKIQLDAVAAESVNLSADLNARRGDRAQADGFFEQLAPLQDGEIIGDGRPDFTRQSHVYRFTADGQKFQLIDVPGIEGDEKQVMSAIEASVKKAHAVFYVTRAATPPGSGSQGQEGTIDKIKRQLGKQTEVWAVYNKSAPTPRHLQGETPIQSNDSVGLVDMDSALTRTLGEETYKGHICVSALPAFLASASCLIPRNPYVKSREKFLAAMSAEDVLKRSGMKAFLEFIRTEICQGFQKKISDANLKKIRSCLQEGVEQLHQARESFADAAKKLKAQQKSASTQIDDLLSSTSQRLQSECHDELSRKKTSMRAAIYDYIERDKSNDDFKDHLTAQVEELKTSIGDDLEARFANVFESFKHEAGEIIKKNQKNVDEILRYTINDPFSSLKLSFTAEFKMSHGINVMGLISSLGGAAALVWASFFASSPVGWTAAAVLGAVGLVFSFYKAVRSFFSSDYKKKQQRKSTDDNLDKVFTKLTEMLDKSLESASAKIGEALADTKEQMRIPYEQSVRTKTALERLATKMMALRDKLVPEPATTASISSTKVTRNTKAARAAAQAA